jgi:hypothetical protein
MFYTKVITTLLFCGFIAEKTRVEKLIEAGHKLIVLDLGLKYCGPCVKVYQR